jgi:hypothetical protein
MATKMTTIIRESGQLAPLPTRPLPTRPPFRNNSPPSKKIFPTRPPCEVW